MNDVEVLQYVIKYNLPSFIEGSPRWHKFQLQNLLAMVEKFGMPDFFYFNRWWSKTLYDMRKLHTSNTLFKKWCLTHMGGLPCRMCVHVLCSTLKNSAFLHSTRPPYSKKCWRIHGTIWNTILRIVACAHYFVDREFRCWTHCKWDYCYRVRWIWYNNEKKFLNLHIHIKTNCSKKLWENNCIHVVHDANTN